MTRIRLSRGQAAAVTAGALVLIAVLDHVTGEGIGFFVFYFLPISIAAWFLGRSPGVLTAVICAALWLAVDVLSGHPAGAGVRAWETAIRLASFLSIALALAEIRESLAREQRLADALTEAMGKVRQLSGLLPICAACKRIRNDDGFWQRIESYISEHSEADFTHSICPECEERLYGRPGR